MSWAGSSEGTVPILHYCISTVFDKPFVIMILISYFFYHLCSYFFLNFKFIFICLSSSFNYFLFIYFYSNCYQQMPDRFSVGFFKEKCVIYINMSTQIYFQESPHNLRCIPTVHGFLPLSQD